MNKHFHTTILLTSIYYSFFENVFNWSKVASYFNWMPKLGVIWGYTYLFMLSYILFTIWILHPNKKYFYFIGIGLFSIEEDIFYWIIHILHGGNNIQVSSWTCRVCGCIYLYKFIIPTWYFLDILFILAVFLIRNRI